MLPARPHNLSVAVRLHNRWVRSGEDLARMPTDERTRIAQKYGIIDVCYEDGLPIGVLLNLLFENQVAQVIEVHHRVKSGNVHLLERHHAVAGAVIADEVVRQVIVHNYRLCPPKRVRHHRPIEALEDLGTRRVLAPGVAAHGENTRQESCAADTEVIAGRVRQVNSGVDHSRNLGTKAVAPPNGDMLSGRVRQVNSGVDHSRSPGTTAVAAPDGDMRS
mmetsp:Transcript_40828/g.117294  ORF Transcript_40828/g.117294 Transcript_40828/m.117294 type:complete len:219 (-) Transcript_40828:4-660(-)